MIPCSFEGENVVMQPPPDMSPDECEPINAFRGVGATGTPLVITCWKLTAAELPLLLAHHRVYLVCFGNTMPPVHLAVDNPLKPTLPPPDVG